MQYTPKLLKYLSVLCFALPVSGFAADSSKPSVPDVYQDLFTFDGVDYQSIRYEIRDGQMVFGDDILLHPSQMSPFSFSSDQKKAMPNGVGIRRVTARWPDGVIPYQFVEDRNDFPGLDARYGAYTTADLSRLRQNMVDVAKDFSDKTSLRIVERTIANASQYPKYVLIGKGAGCSSHIGNVGPSTGYQLMSLAGGCFGSSVVIHEFGHAFGLFHEQSRSDRDSYVTVNTANIADGREHNFDKVNTRYAIDLGPYNYESIMHYSRRAFSKNGLDTITPLGGQEIGRRLGGLNSGDANALNALYATDLTVTSQMSNYLKADANFDWLIRIDHNQQPASNTEARGITIIAQLPSTGYQLVGQSVGWNCVLHVSQVACSSTTKLAPAGSMVLTLTLKTPNLRASNKSFSASASSLTFDSNMNNNTDDDLVSVLTGLENVALKNMSTSSGANGRASVTLGWNATLNATKYSVQRSEMELTGFVELANVTETKYVDTTASLDKTYYYRLEAQNDFESKTSAVRSIEISPQVLAPVLVATLQSSDAQETAISLNWNRVTGAASYEVLRSSGSGSFLSVSNLQSSDTSFVISDGLSAGTEYHFKVVAKNDVSEQESNVSTVVTPSMVSIESSGGGGGSIGLGFMMSLCVLLLFRLRSLMA